ncbi:MAG: RNA-splicing ligase RtcB, partial [Dehalococcoidia bacterium]
MSQVRTTNWRDMLQRIDPYRWELPVDYKPGMRVPARIYADETLLDIAGEEEAIEQAANVATLPGIVWRSLAMPDIHWGYGFPIGGVAAMRLDDGVVSPGGVGFDINCGVRLITTDLREEDVRPVLKQLVDQLFRDIPAGLGGTGELSISDAEVDGVMVRGAA